MPMTKIGKLFSGMVVMLVLAVVSPQTWAQAAGQKAASATLKGDAAHPAHAVRWVDTRLYFGLGPADDATKGVSEARWREFLDKEVTPRFPSGLSVVDVYGQWQGKKNPTPSRLRSKLLIIDYQDSQENRDKVEAIRSAW